MSFSILGIHISGAVVVLGAITGMVYGVSAVALVLVYRSSRLINFAQGSVGTVGAAVLGLAATHWGLPYWACFVVALAAGGAVGALAEAAVARSLRHAPVVVGVVVTLGLGQVLQLVAGLINTGVAAGTTFPQPTGLPTFGVGALLVTPAYAAMLFITPVVVAALALFLRRSRVGLGMLAAAANPEGAEMSGIVSNRMAALAWGLAGALAVYTAVLVLPTRGFSSSDFLGPGLLLRALVCAVVARMASIPVALVSGVALGVTESILLANYPNSGLVEVMIFVILVVVLLAQRAKAGRSDDKGTWAAITPWGPLPASYRSVFSIRHLGRLVGGAALTGAVVIPIFVSNSDDLILAGIAAFALVGLSVGLITGLGGQLSLGQFGLAGVGAAVSVILTGHGVNFVLALVVAAAAAAACSLVLGLPALRLSGLMLAVTSLAFALAAQDWLLGEPWMLGSGRTTRTPSIGGLSFASGRAYYYVALGVLLVGLALTRNIWQGNIGRRLRAVRDNEAAARAFGLPAVRVKLQGFVLAGLLAGLGGVVYGTSITLLSSTAFPSDLSISAAAAAVVGGLGVIAGPLLGALYIIGVPHFLPLDNAELAATSVGWLLVVVNRPGGMAQGMGGLRDRIVDGLARRAGLDPMVERAAAAPAEQRPPELTSWATGSPRGISLSDRQPAAGEEPLLRVLDITVRYGGVEAVSEVSLAVAAGETVGLIGPNGAGKTTLFEVLGGFVRPARGSVAFAGRDVTAWAPERRAGLGLIRSFQDAALFPTMTVTEVVVVAVSRLRPPGLAAALALGRRADRHGAARADELVGAMGLSSYRHVPVHALSTGTRRIVELACLLAAEPRLLLLDEPTSGIAQAEAEALGVLLARVRDQLSLTLVVIEHDIPLLMTLADRIVAMEAGRVIADGAPNDVRRDPAVIASYLGTDPTAIARSQSRAPRGTAPAAPGPSPMRLCARPAGRGHKPRENR